MGFLRLGPRKIALLPHLRCICFAISCLWRWDSDHLLAKNGELFLHISDKNSVNKGNIEYLALTLIAKVKRLRSENLLAVQNLNPIIRFWCITTWVWFFNHHF